MTICFQKRKFSHGHNLYCSSCSILVIKFTSTLYKHRGLYRASKTKNFLPGRFAPHSPIAARIGPVGILVARPVTYCGVPPPHRPSNYWAYVDMTGVQIHYVHQSARVKTVVSETGAVRMSADRPLSKITYHHRHRSDRGKDPAGRR